MTRRTPAQLAAELDQMAADRDAQADRVSPAMEEIGPTEALMHRRIAEGFRALAAAVRGDVPVPPRVRRVA